MRMIWIALGVLAGALASIAPSAAQNTTGLVVSVCGSPPNAFVAGRPGPFTVDTTGTLCDAGGGGGGSAVPFTPNGNFGTLTATASSSASTALPAGATVALQNTSTVDVSCVLSSGAATATTNKIVVRGGATVFVAVGANVNAACINQTGSASNVVVMAGGSGLGTNFGGGSSGGSSGAVFGPTANGSPAANPPVLMGGTSNGTATGNVGNWKVDSSGTGYVDAVAAGNLINAINTPVPACNASPCTTVIGAFVGYQGTAALSATNGWYANLLQGNAVLSATNGLYANQLQGNAVLSATNPSFARPTDGTNARVFDPCEVVAHVTTPISISSAATSVIVAGTSAKKTYICSMMLMSAGTTNVGIVQGSGTTCGTSTLGLIGGATAATGPNLTAQAGFVAGNGNFAIAGTTVNANDICLIDGSAIQVSGYIVTATP